MDKKSIIGLVLIFGIFAGYIWWVSPSKEEMAERQRIRDSIARAYNDSLRQADSIAKALADADSATLAAGLQADVQKSDMGVFNAAAEGDARLLSVNNGLMTIEFSTLGAHVDRVVLDDYRTYDSGALVLITPSDDNLDLVFSTEDNRVVNTKNLVFKPYINGEIAEESSWQLGDGDSMTIAFRAEIAADSGVAAAPYLEFCYTIRSDSYRVGFDIRFEGLSKVVRNTPYVDLVWRNRMQRQEKVREGTRSERSYTSIYYKPPRDKVDNLTAGRDDSEQVRTKLEWVAFKQQYFCAILTSNGESFENADLSVATDKGVDDASYLTDMKATIGLPYRPETAMAPMEFYFGPTKYRDLHAMDRDYDKMLPLGWTVISKSISRWLILPVFNFLERFGWNYGIIIIVFTILIRLVLLPLVYKSYRGSAIMRILKPEMDALNAKFPKPEQAMQKQQQMMALQKRAGYSPMAGCLPMLIQMPFLTAMFMFYPIAIELRQKSFLWCDDLSTYDSILDFGFNIPLYGDHISLFCLMMFAMQFFYTWYTMRGQNMNAGMPGMKFMMYFMPFFMLFIFNSQSAGLNIYYFTSLTITMITMMLIRAFTSESSVRAHMAAYDKKHAGGNGKPKKKSRFAARMEEMQKMAEQMQKQKQQKR